MQTPVGAEADAATAITASATILLVDDEPAVRLITRRMLEGSGFTVLDAESGARAIGVAEQYGGPIDLVLTDVVMPGMNGRAVATEMLRIRPGIRVLFMSGQSAEVLARHGVLDEGRDLLQKPFGRDALCGKIRALLDDAVRGSEP